MSSRFATKSHADVALRAGVATLAVANGYIHSQLGGWMFTANAVGWLALAAALVAPVWPAPQVRWLTRLAFFGFAGATAAGWIAFGARYDMGYLSFAIDLVVVALMAADILVADGSPVTVAKKVVHLGARLVPGGAGAHA